ncbi:methylated-DNA--[protein]-cysteine S-methyltransferase [Velocimicrobium porci]|uniref:hypothetical protein n=1 Tax=Velocimicrobium porci TaxID=2606634 RepID=UPI0012B3F046|nr:hypothetical protein [Velocimicrobium porci]
MKYYQIYDMPIGKMKIQEESGAIIRVTLSEEIVEDEIREETEIIRNAAKQLEK